MTEDRPMVNAGASEENPSATEEGGASTRSVAGTEEASLQAPEKSPDLREAGREAEREAERKGEREADIGGSPPDPLAAVTAPQGKDDATEAVLLQAGAEPLPRTSAKLSGSKTLMGIGIAGFDLKAFRDEIRAKGGVAATATPGAPGQDVSSPRALDGAAGGSPPPAEAFGAPLVAAATRDDQAGASFLDEVGQALDAQAAEYRDRARGQLPAGMPVTVEDGGERESGFSRPSDNAAEFEDPDEAGQTSVTLGPIALVEEELAEDVAIEDLHEGATAHQSPQPTAPWPPQSLPAAARFSESRATRVPPVPGISLASTPPLLGPPPGAAPRSSTPSPGPALSSASPSTSPASGRVRFPTPAPVPVGSSLPAPYTGRVVTSPLAGSGSSTGTTGPDLTATMPSTPLALENSRRSPAAAVSTSSGSGRVSTRAPARVTEQVLRPAPSSFQAILTAHVKLATVTLAGLVALTFAGGLFVGMLVWRGQSRSEPSAAASAGATPGSTEASTAVRVPPEVKPGPAQAGSLVPARSAGTPVVVEAPPATPPEPGPVLVGAAAGALGAAAVVSAKALVPRAAESRASTKDVRGAGADSPAGRDTPTTDAPARNAAGIAQRPSRPRRAAVAAGATVPRDQPPTPAAAAAAAGAAAAAAANKPLVSKPATGRPTVVPAAFKPMADNAAAKPAAPKTKAKAAWRDPFAD